MNFQVLYRKRGLFFNILYYVHYSENSNIIQMWAEYLDFAHMFPLRKMLFLASLHLSKSYSSFRLPCKHALFSKAFQHLSDQEKSHQYVLS